MQLRLSSGTTSGGADISGGLDILVGGWVDLRCSNDSGGKESSCKSDGELDCTVAFWRVQPRAPKYLPTRLLLPEEGFTQQMRLQKPETARVT